MGLTIEMLLVTSTVGALQSAFFGVYLFTMRKGRTLANVLLGLLLVAFAIRIFKSVGYYFSDSHVIPDLLMNLGFGSNLGILPLLWLYLNAFLKKDYRFSWERDFVHLIPALVALVLSPFLTDYFWMNLSGYTVSLLMVIAYLPFCIRLIVKYFGSLSRPQRMWVVSLSVGVTIVWFCYLGNFVFGLIPYIAAPVMFSVVIYFLSFLALKEGGLLIRDVKYEKSTYTQIQIDSCHSELQQLLYQTRPFMDSTLTLPKLASQLGVSANLLSETINKKIGQNFPDFINGYRVREAQALLEKPEYENQKIAAIAFETGFNSLSVFNAAFKKFTAMTPSTFRKAVSRK
ncbi:MAG TPA: helix-turn-helix domain-containing protein [Chryseolinea sp.]|nr:helix-turn-helix domain-containing protein [Chryseolinea sp.]